MYAFLNGKIICILIFLGPIFILAQEYEIVPVSTFDNKESPTGRKLLYVDDEGFLWYSIYNGVVKYTGNDHVFFPISDQQSEVFHKGHYIIDILISKKDKLLLLCTDMGLWCKSLVTGEEKWIIPRHPDTNEKVEVYSVKEDKQGNLWITTQSPYLFYYDSAKEKLTWTKILNDDTPDLINNGTKIVEQFEDGSLLLDHGIDLYHFKNGLVEKLNKTVPKIGYWSAKNGKIFSKNMSSQFKFNDKYFSFFYAPIIDRQIFQLPKMFIWHVIEAESQNLFWGAQFIARRHHGKVNELLFFKFEKNNQGFYEFVLKNSIELKENPQKLFTDQNGIIWIHSGKTIKKLKIKQTYFEKSKIFNSDDGNRIRDHVSFRGIEEDSKGNIYATSYSGLYKKSVNQNEFHPMNLKHHDSFYTQKAGVKRYSFPSKGSFYEICFMRDSILIGVGNHIGLSVIDLNSSRNEYIKTPFIDPVSENTPFFDIIPVNENIVMLGGNDGLYEFNLKTFDYKNISKLNEQYDVSGLQVYKIHRDVSEGTLWIAANNGLGAGLYRKNLFSGKVDYFSVNTIKMPLIDKTINDIYEDSDGVIWIGTPNGVQKVFSPNLASNSIDIANNFKNNHVASILGDSYGNLWVGTYDGLLKLNKKTGEFVSYFEGDGLTDNEFNKKAALRASDGTMYMGGINGINMFSPKSFINKLRPEKNDLKLVEIRTFNSDKEVYEKQHFGLDGKREFLLPYDKNHLILSFAVSQLFNPEKNFYQYKIKELNNSWNNMQANGKLELIGLSPNEYSLEVRGINSGGQYTNVLEYMVNIKQVFYKQTWFLITMVVVILAFILAWSYYKRKRMSHEFLLKEEIRSLETKALQAQMNPHFIFNALNSVHDFIAKQDRLSAHKYLSRFGKLIRLSLDYNNYELITLNQELNILKVFVELEQLHFDNLFDFRMDILLDQINEIMVPPFILQPFVENSIKHGFRNKREVKGLIVLSIKKGENDLHFMVSDNGSGFHNSIKMNNLNSKTYKSKGLKITEKRIKQINRKYKRPGSLRVVESHGNIGVKIVFDLPLITNTESK